MYGCQKIEILLNNVNPTVLNDLERKAKQILLEFSSTEANDVLAKSLAELKDKANNIIGAMEDSKDVKKLANTKIESVQLHPERNTTRTPMPCAHNLSPVMLPARTSTAQKWHQCQDKDDTRTTTESRAN